MSQRLREHLIAANAMHLYRARHSVQDRFEELELSNASLSLRVDMANAVKSPDWALLMPAGVAMKYIANALKHYEREVGEQIHQELNDGPENVATVSAKTLMDSQLKEDER